MPIKIWDQTSSPSSLTPRRRIPTGARISVWLTMLLQSLAAEQSSASYQPLRDTVRRLEADIVRDSGCSEFSGHVPPNWLAAISREHRARLADDRDMIPGGLARSSAVSAHDCGDD